MLFRSFETTRDDLIQGLGPVSFTIDRSSDRGQILNEETYEVGNLNPIASVTNVYEEEEMTSSISGYKAGTRFDIQSNGMAPINQNLSTFRKNYFFLTYYNTPVIWKRLKSSTRVNDGVSTTKEYFYNAEKKHTNPINTITFDSNGNQIESIIYYPEDITETYSLAEGGNLSSYELQVIQAMKTINPMINQPGTNQLNYPIQNVTKVNGNTTSVQRTIYDYDDGIILPETIQTASGNNDVEDRVLYSNYKNGKLVEVKKAEGAKTCYIWGYNNQ